MKRGNAHALLAAWDSDFRSPKGTFWIMQNFRFRPVRLAALSSDSLHLWSARRPSIRGHGAVYWGLQRFRGIEAGILPRLENDADAEDADPLRSLDAAGS